MGEKQLHRLHLMKLMEEGKITLKEATGKIGVSYRQAKRIRSTSKRGCETYLFRIII